jgi:hypothetical protein
MFGRRGVDGVIGSSPTVSGDGVGARLVRTPWDGLGGVLVPDLVDTSRRLRGVVVDLVAAVELQ